MRLLRKTKFRVEALAMTPLFLSLRAEGEAISQVGWNSYSVVFTLNASRFTIDEFYTSYFPVYLGIWNVEACLLNEIASQNEIQSRSTRNDIFCSF